MSGTSKVKPPKDDAEWARGIQRRVEQVEHPSSTRVGAWVISTEPDTGDLIASNVNGGSVVIANEPGDGADADAVASEYSAVKVERRATQSGSGYLPISWDTVAMATSDWAVSEGSAELLVPSDGLWMITCRLQSPGVPNYYCKARVDIDGEPRMAGRHIPGSGSAAEAAIFMAEPFSLTAGTGVVLNAWNSGGSGTWGASGSDPSVVTFLSLVRLPIG